MEDAEQTQTQNKEIGLAHSIVPPANTEHCEDQHGTIVYVGALQSHSQGVAINPDLFSSKQISLKWKEHTYPSTEYSRRMNAEKKKLLPYN